MGPTALIEAPLGCLPDHWRLSRLALRVERPGDFETDFALPARLRGALGHALLARSSDPEWDVARRILFETTPWRARAELPKPFTIAVDEDAAHLEITLTLFGSADRWRRPVFDGMVEALGFGIAAHGRSDPPLRRLAVASAAWTRTESIAVPAPSRAARLLFRTPLRLGGGRVFGLRWGDIVVSLAKRAAGLAVWQGLQVEPALGPWRAMANRLTFLDADLFPAGWNRRSGAQGGRTIAMNGVLGPLDILSPPEALMPLLALGETMFVGGGASLGLGRYDLL